MRRVLAITGLLAILLCFGCVTMTPGERSDLPADSGSSGSRHRPGQPCLVCHNFEMAGTVYRRAGDADGLEGVEVQLTDAIGHQFTVPTNSAGTFYVRFKAGISEPRVSVSKGRVKIPWVLEYPVEVEISSGATTQVMRSRMYRRRSCAFCHTSTAGAASAGHIFLEETP